MKRAISWLRENLLTVIILVPLLGLLGLFIYVFYIVDANIKLGAMSFLTAAGIAIYTNYQTREREIDSRHFSAKSDGYKIFFNLLFDILKATKSGKQVGDHKLLKGIMEFKKAMMIWGDADVIAAWNEYERQSANSPGGEEFFGPIEVLLRAIRKDLGHNDELMAEYQLVQMFLDEDGKNELTGGE